MEVRHFWQPDLNTKRYAPADEGAWSRMGAAPPTVVGSVWVDPVLPLADVDVTDLTHALDDVRVPVFLDWGHTNELGARVVAQAMYDDLRPDLESLAAAR